ncbi:MAG: LuxR C-terminal-related transcriptional regulator [Spirochaetales bacterium]|jgi:LuxR family maltose regulon positive regulatory protein|nr:LuxR C-terminal-related transcriptional regulator [Spirochaetales bacterium]
MTQQLFCSDAPAGAENQFFLERPRIDRLLAKAMQSHIVIVVAGAGDGKTHAVNSFLQKNPRRAVWIQLSERDNLGWRFWENYTGALSRLNPEAAKIFATMGFPESERQFDRYLTLLKSEVECGEPYTIVLDDFHFLTNPAVLLYLERVLAAPVSKNTIVLISRTEPAINTVGFLAKGRLSRVTAEDLRFTREEVAEYARFLNIFLTEEELTRIYHETEGWALAAGLILQGIKTGQADKGSWDGILLPVRKMIENMFMSMEEGLQKFLIKLSLVDYWPRSLLERLDPGGKYISAIEKFGSVIRFDIYLHGFFIHHLFLEFLREKQAVLSREEIRDVSDRGAQWCIENNLPTDAAVEYERARDYGGLVRLIDSFPRLLSRRVASFFLEMIDRITAENTGDRDDWNFLFLRFISRARFLALLNRFQESSDEYQAGIACFEALPPCPRRSSLLAAACHRMGILCVLIARFTKDYNFVQWFERAYYYFLENPQEPVSEQMAQSNVSSYVIPIGFPAKTGEIEAILEAYSVAVPYSSASQNGYFFGIDTLARAEIAYYQGDLNTAEQFARQAVFQGREKNQYEVEHRALVYLMWIYIHTGDVAGIQEVERQMKGLLEKDGYINRFNIYDVVMGRFYTQIGLTKKIASWLRTEYLEEALDILFRGFDILIKPLSLFAEKDFPAALKALEEEKARGNLGSFLFGFLEMTALEAVIRHQLGDRDGAFKTLKKAYDAASPNALNIPFVELGESMHSLITAILKDRLEGAPGAGGVEEIPRNWLYSIRSKASAYAKKCSLVMARYADQNAGGFLDFSEHELAILGGLSCGHTAKKIADDMKISVKMVKSVIRSVYSKLGATNRAAAVRAATAKGLL